MGSTTEFMEAIKEFNNLKSVLEIGCGDGHFIKLMKKSYQDTRVVGLELNRKTVEKNRAHGFEVSEQTIESFADEKVNHEAFDAVCSFQVLEHVPNPRAFIESSLKCLKKGGFLFISVPNRDGFTQYLVNDILNMPPHHITRWNYSVIKNVSKLFNLQIKSFKEEPVAEYHKKSYRMALLKKYIADFIGVKFRSVEPPFSIRYKIVQFFAFMLDIIIPKSFWKYNKFTGHTLCTTLIKN
ncbi:class I SAM-dependent methyltransferase [Candidatus Peregrinibacteria bacterium]|nr:class I SAM-dependent methyltransferase [Candidatus Peregrinibacteria bacterium]